MIIRKIELNSPYREQIRAINTEAFPVEERMSIEEMYNWRGRSEVLGFYEDDELVGFALILMNEAVVFMVLLAIDCQYRGQGYGSKVLAAIKNEFPDMQIILDFEEVNENSVNYAQRISRKQFYLRNGFHETGRYTKLGNERFEVVCSEENLNEAALLDIMASIHLHTPEFNKQLFR